MCQTVRSKNQTYYIGVEIGGTKQQVAVGTANGTILNRYSVKLGQRTTAAEILSWIGTTVDAIRAEWAISAIGVGFGGPIDPDNGEIVCSLQVDGWKNFNLYRWFEARFQLPTVTLNDTVTGGVAEWKLGAGRNSRRLFYTNIGTGIGGGLYDQSGYRASSLGYTWIPDWRSADPGAATRLEFLCAGSCIEKRLNQPGYVPAASILSRQNSPITCAALADGVHQGDLFSTEELDRIADSFSMGLANVLALACPDCIVIGGGVAKMGDILFSRLRQFTAKHAFVGTLDAYQILPSALMDDAVLAGGLLVAADPDLARLGRRKESEYSH